MNRPVLNNMVQNSSQCRAFTGTGGSSHQNQTVAVATDLPDYRWQPQFIKAGDLLWNNTCDNTKVVVGSHHMYAEMGNILQ